MNHKLKRTQKHVQLLSDYKTNEYVQALIPYTKEELRLARNGQTAHLQIVNTKNIESAKDDKRKA